jgi:hypothetical protein
MIIYHYTNQFGLKSIIENRSIWLSNSRLMNDSFEGFYLGRYGRDKYIQAVLTKYPKLSIEVFVNLYDHVLSSLEYYVASFSENGDLLDQWRSYGSDGNGVTIGIEMGPIIGSEVPPYWTASQDQMPSIMKCKYSYEEFDQVLSRIFSVVYPNMESNFVASMWANEIGRMGILCKHPAFVNEKEIRMIYRPVRAKNVDGNFFYSGSLGQPSWRVGRLLAVWCGYINSHWYSQFGVAGAYLIAGNGSLPAMR